MSSTNRKRAARALAAERGITYQQALTIVTGHTPTALDANWRGRFADGYTPQDVAAFFTHVAAVTGVRLTCVWGGIDAYGAKGDSQWYVVDGGMVFDLVGGLWTWVNTEDGPTTPGVPSTWRGETLPPSILGVAIDEWNTAASDPDGYAAPVWADADGTFALHGGTRGNPGCDQCGQADAVAKVHGEYLCAATLTCRTPGCSEDPAGGEGWAGYCGNCADRAFGLTCRYCGEPMSLERDEVSHHTGPDGQVDYDADGDHVAVRDDE